MKLYMHTVINQKDSKPHNSGKKSNKSMNTVAVDIEKGKEINFV